MNKIILGDCLDVMNDIDDKSIDMVMCDLPYGVTKNKWDSIIDINKLWIQYMRVLKPSGVIALTASQPFSSMLVSSRYDLFKHEWIWIKNRGSNFANTVREPFKEHEHVLIFAQDKWTYNKQMQQRTGSGNSRVKYKFNMKTKSKNYNKFNGIHDAELSDLRVPSSWQKFNTDTSGIHPTIKPVGLFEYMIRTYTNEGETVLDNAAGSGTTGIACLNSNRKYILIEKCEKYFSIMKKRIEDHNTEEELAI